MGKKRWARNGSESNDASYAQVVSLYDDTSISVSNNETDKVLTGSLYTETNEQGLTIPSSLLKNWNEQTGKNLTTNDLIGKSVSASIVESAAETSKIAQFQTKIVRVINDEDDMEDSNSFMLSHQMETILKEAGFTKAVSYFILELKDPSQTKVVTEELQKNKKYTVFSQQRVLDIVITFIRVIQGLLIVLSSQAIVVAAVMIGIIIYINIMQHHATFQGNRCHESSWLSESWCQRNFYLRGYLDCRHRLAAGIFGCTRGGKFGECDCKSLLPIHH